MSLQNGRKITPFLASKMSVTTAYRNAVRMKHHSNIYSPWCSPKFERTLHRYLNPFAQDVFRPLVGCLQNLNANEGTICPCRFGPLRHALCRGVHPKMKISYQMVFGVLSRMVKVRGACDKPFGYISHKENCASPCRKSDDVLVVEELAVTPHGNASSSQWRAATALALVCVFLTILIGGQPQLFSRCAFDWYSSGFRRVF